MNVSLAIDVGATKVAVGLVTLSGQVLARIDVNSKAGSIAELNGSLADAIKSVMATPDVVVVGAGIGSAGPIDNVKGTINPVNIPHWVDFSLVDFVREVSGLASVRIIGDASALAYAEFVLGAGRGATNLMGIVVSTGIGGGVVLNGAFHVGRTGNAGMIGHSVVVQGGNECACGQRGCVEAYSSGTNMAKDFGAANFEAVASAARSGDGAAVAAIEKGAAVLALGLLNAVALMDLDTIVVGGGVMLADDVYWPILVKHFEKEMKVLNFPGNVALKKATLGKDSGLVGAGLVGFISPTERA
ncbi:glucokinase [Candidatus Planktophila sulfonica]|uniref:Glucokinase n=1 Tax=Candidatus Planktophila sulfonica TaxID=1884904 RepID=A0A249KG51_9ACTN|nr:ROK family protein [Candidatus Planktophila sulfonica]ASY15747.1 glucokinase [Candidatus Planktophila sulfonica]